MIATKVIAFDLGDTLVEYEGVPLNWESHYLEALGNLLAFLDISATPHQLFAACEVLRRFNTRINPRTEETSFAVIAAEVAKCIDAPEPFDEIESARAFFRVFRQRLRRFSDTSDALRDLRARGVKIGIFTDVPYGMPQQLVLEDVVDAGLAGTFHTLITSRDANFRKPSPVTLRSLAHALGCEPRDMTHVGNEKKDIEVARAVGCSAILIDRNGHGADWGQDFTISSLAEL